MQSGLFINNDFISLVSLKNDSDFTEGTLIELEKIYLYFNYNKRLDPPLELTPEAKFIYYPGNPDILGDVIKFVDHPEEKCKIHGKEFKRFDILTSIINKLLSENLDKLKLDNEDSNSSSFLLITPPYISEELKNKLLGSVRNYFKDVETVDYVIPYLNSLVNENKLHSLGNVLFIEMGFSDFYFSILKPSYKNQEYEIRTIEESIVKDTEIVLKVLSVVAGELVKKVIADFDHSNISDEDFIEANTLSNIEYAQDILNEVYQLEEWTSVSIEVELDNGITGEVTVYKEKIVKEINLIPENESIEEKVQHLIKTFKPKTILIFGENIEKYLLGDYFNRYSECQIIQHDSDSYKNICLTAFKTLASTDEPVYERETLDSEDEKTLDEPVSVTEDIIHDDSIQERGVKSKKKKLVVYFLIPIIVIIAAILIYQFIGKKSDEVNVSTDIAQTESEDASENNIEVVPDVDYEDTIELTAEDVEQDQISEEPTTPSDHMPIVQNEDKEEITNEETKEIIQPGKTIEINEKTEETVVEDSVTEVGDEIEIKQWAFEQLNAYLNSIRNTGGSIGWDDIPKSINRNCIVCRYSKGTKTDSKDDILTFIKKVKLIGIGEIVENSLLYDSQGKIIEFGQMQN